MPHIHEKIDFTVEVFVIYNNKVLLRKHDKYGIWLSVGGHVELHEDPNQAAIREVKEEVGLEIELHTGKRMKHFEKNSYQELIPPEFMNRHRINESHEHVTLVYFAKTNTNKLALSETEKTKGCKWFTLEELDNIDNISDTIKMYAKTALSKLSN